MSQFQPLGNHQSCVLLWCVSFPSSVTPNPRCKSSSVLRDLPLYKLSTGCRLYESPPDGCSFSCDDQICRKANNMVYKLEPKTVCLSVCLLSTCVLMLLFHCGASSVEVKWQKRKIKSLISGCVKPFSCLRVNLTSHYKAEEESWRRSDASHPRTVPVCL